MRCVCPEHSTGLIDPISNCILQTRFADVLSVEVLLDLFDLLSCKEDGIFIDLHFESAFM